MNAAVILLSRMASRRLPGKALARIGRRTILEHCLGRLCRPPAPLPVVLATTDRPEDDALEKVAERAGVRTFRGPAHDVLKRVVLAARALEIDYVVRATADNPVVDIDAPARVLNLIAAIGADHVTESDLPYGAAVEAVTFDALVRADQLAKDAADREHVTSIIRRDRTCFNAVTLCAPRALRRPELRLTVDTAADLEYMRRLTHALGDPLNEPSLADVIRAADSLTDPEAAR